MKLKNGTKVRRGKRIPKTVRGWKVITPGGRGFKASCESRFEYRGGKFVVLRVF
jgi:hypothetical protein